MLSHKHRNLPVHKYLKAASGQAWWIFPYFKQESSRTYSTPQRRKPASNGDLLHFLKEVQLSSDVSMAHVYSSRLAVNDSQAVPISCTSRRHPPAGIQINRFFPSFQFSYSGILHRRRYWHYTWAYPRNCDVSSQWISHSHVLQTLRHNAQMASQHTVSGCNTPASQFCLELIILERWPDRIVSLVYQTEPSDIHK